MEIAFPFEFIVYGTPVAIGASRRSRDEWTALVREAATLRLPDFYYATSAPLAVTLFNFPAGRMQGDVDNIVKYTLDAMSRRIYLDDKQVERVVVQKFEADRLLTFRAPTPVLASCIAGPRPALYIHLTTDIDGSIR